MNILKKTMLFGALLLVAGCGSTTGSVPETVDPPVLPDNYTTYENADGWSISHPESWKVDEANYAATGLVGFKAPSESKTFQAHLGITKKATEFTEDVYDYEELSEVVGKALEETGATNVVSKKFMTPVGPSARMDGDLIKETLDLKVTQMQIYRDYEGYILNFMSEVSEYDGFMEDVELMLLSFNPGE